MKAILQLLALIIKSDALQNAAAQPVANLLIEYIPDSEEDAIAGFLRKIADRLEKAH